MFQHPNSTLLSVFVERRHPDTNSFHKPWGKMTVTLHNVELILGLPAYGKAVDLHYSGDQMIAVIQSDLGTLVRPRVLIQRSWLGAGHCLRYRGSLTSFKRSETFGFPHGIGCLRISIVLRRTCLIELFDSSGGANTFRHILFNPKRLDTESRECSTWFSSLMGIIVREIDRDDATKEERLDKITKLVKLHYLSSY
ncbi:hypothetical protein M9H77_20875 [Catharanthus roseus]|uniref:Uncharacterized protein n=1 Tax=Catharanthus roseus TaxID=4058 RepID=A0ACC0AM78_CATRO|nr:hypothetical protein M9H77_20875 [Catharanthus roseus]